MRAEDFADKSSSRKRYVVVPGYVKSTSDGDTHYITAYKLIQLYNVEPRHCYIRTDKNKDSIPRHLPTLSPDPTGKYRLPK